MTPIQKPAHRIEMANGRINAMSGGGGVDMGALEEVMLERDGLREQLRAEVREATGLTAIDLIRALSI